MIDQPATSPATAPEGHVQLRWEPPASDGAEPLHYQIEQSRSSDFTAAEVRDLGPDRATFVSGLPPGTVWFRVRAVDGSSAVGPWSEPVAVRVVYPSRELVRNLLILGFLVFLATVGFVLGGHLKSRHRGSREPIP